MEKLPTRWNLDDSDFCAASYYESCENSKIHWHTHYLLTVYTDGQGVLSINGVDRTVSAGDVVILSNTDFHSHKIGEGERLSLYSIKFHYDRCSPEVCEGIPIECFPIYAHLEGECWELAKSLAGYVHSLGKKRTKQSGSRIASRLAIEQLLVMAYENKLSAGEDNLFSQLSAPGRIAELSSRNKQIYQAVCYIQEHFREASLKVSDIAAGVGYTEHYFSETFKRILGCPCKLYIQKCRLEFARRLLLSGGLTVTQVCYEAGFKDLSYFISLFKGVYGAPPGRYSESKE